MRPIDADALAEAVKERIGLETGIGMEINGGMVVAYAMIAMAPTLNLAGDEENNRLVRELDAAYSSLRNRLKEITLDDLRPKGRWIVQDKTFTRFRCSHCECKNFGQRWNFCPACGAEMEVTPNE